MTKILTPPLDPVANIYYRKQLRHAAVNSRKTRDHLIHRSQEDFFFWLHSFGWILNPRAKRDQSTLLPFIAYDFQIPVIQQILDNFGNNDVGIEKSRAMGATYICLNVLVWNWLFRPSSELAMVSRNLETADSFEDPSSLGNKFDLALKLMPEWMVGVKGRDFIRNISRHMWSRNDNGSTLAAYATGGTVASGARKLCVFIDEFGKHQRPDDEKLLVSLGAVTNCRLVCSTYFGADGAFYQLMKTPSSMVKVFLRWEDHPLCGENKFRIDYKNKRLLHPTEDIDVLGTYATEFFEQHAPTLESRGFTFDEPNKVWSPWYVEQCTRIGATKVSIRQEYDREPAGSSSRFVDYNVINKLLTKCTPALWRGNINYVLGTNTPERLMPSHGGPLKLWLRDVEGKGWKPPFSDYVLGVDIAAGTGTSYSSNSVITILDRNTGVKVGEFASNNIMPARLCDTAVALAKLFYDGYIVFERNGPGQNFASRLLDGEYRNIYFQTQQQSVRRKPTKVPGWWSDANSKRMLLGKYAIALMEGFFENPSEPAIIELGQYGPTQGDKIAFIPISSVDLDPSDEGASHGDRAIADALANFGMEHLGGSHKQRVNTKKELKRPTPPDGSFAARRDLYLAKQRRNTENDKFW